VQVDDIIAVCAGLVTIDEESNIIRLVHFTTQEYFQRTKARWFPTAEEDISIICVTYLSFRQFKTGTCDTDDELKQRLQSNPLYNYAARNWGHHARKALDLSQDTRASFTGEYNVKLEESFKTASQAVIDFLEREENIRAATQALREAERWSPFQNYSQEFARQMTALHINAYFGVEEAAKALLNKGAAIESKDNSGRTPLIWAAENGHEALVKLLVDEGAAIESKDSFGQTPLSSAAENGHEAVVKLLLDEGAAIKSEDNSSQTPLSWAARNGYEAVVKLLLDKGAAIEANDNDSGQTPLSWAVENGHEAVVQLLLATGQVDAV